MAVKFAFALKRGEKGCAHMSMTLQLSPVHPHINSLEVQRVTIILNFFSCVCLVWVKPLFCQALGLQFAWGETREFVVHFHHSFFVESASDVARWHSVGLGTHGIGNLTATLRGNRLRLLDRWWRHSRPYTGHEADGRSKSYSWCD